MATDHRHAQPAEAAHPSADHRSRLTDAKGALRAHQRPGWRSPPAPQTRHRHSTGSSRSSPRSKPAGASATFAQQPVRRAEALAPSALATPRPKERRYAGAHDEPPLLLPCDAACRRDQPQQCLLSRAGERVRDRVADGRLSRCCSGLLWSPPQVHRVCPHLGERNVGLAARRAPGGRDLHEQRAASRWSSPLHDAAPRPTVKAHPHARRDRVGVDVPY
jgi:hypothetical protein